MKLMFRTEKLENFHQHDQKNSCIYSRRNIIVDRKQYKIYGVMRTPLEKNDDVLGY